jgi:glyoxylase-like metal-dependent hydrolase (beta-lactamase superfamily II)
MRFALLALALTAAPAFAEDVKIITTPVAGPVSMIEGRGGNIGISSGEDGMLMIDTQYANISGPIEDAMKKIGPGPLKFIINTHFHQDHTGGDINFGQKAPVIAQENVRTRLLVNKDLKDAAVRNSLPTVTYAETASVHFNGEELRLVHLPKGHTDGDTMIIFTKSNVVHTGDQFTNGMYPFIDVATGGGTIDGYLANLAKMISVIPDDARIIPGHGKLATKKDLLTFQATLTDTIGIIRKELKDGKTLEEAQNAGLPSKYDSWGKDFVSTKSWITNIYKNSTK